MEYNSSLVGWGGPLPEGGDQNRVQEVLKAVRINTPEQVRLELNHKQKPFFGQFATLKIPICLFFTSLWLGGPFSWYVVLTWRSGQIN